MRERVSLGYLKNKESSRVPLSELTQFTSTSGFKADDEAASTASIDLVVLGRDDFEGTFPGEWQLGGEPTWAAARASSMDSIICVAISMRYSGPRE